MCLATVYGKKQESESVLIKNASRIDVEGNNIRIRDIMGSEITVEGTISMVDLANAVVKINCIE